MQKGFLGKQDCKNFDMLNQCFAEAIHANFQIGQAFQYFVNSIIKKLTNWSDTTWRVRSGTTAPDGFAVKVIGKKSSTSYRDFLVVIPSSDCLYLAIVKRSDIPKQFSIYFPFVKDFHSVGDVARLKNNDLSESNLNNYIQIILNILSKLLNHDFVSNESSSSDMQLKSTDSSAGIDQVFDKDSIEMLALEGIYKEQKIQRLSRNQAIIDKRKLIDNYKCQACGFVLKIGGSYILDCHHIKPLTSEQITSVDDLVSLCPTCHRIAHKRPKPFNVREIKRILESANN